jgi:LysR family transcriptional regulator, hypochlorite-specific transcription factor HypT
MRRRVSSSSRRHIDRSHDPTGRGDTLRAVETKWLEDFVSLAETRSFSRSAQLRHITQPAFSRRIQSLEAWAGIDLVDRSSYPTRLTPAGETFHSQALEIIGSLQATRNMMRGHTVAGADMIEFAVSHSLAFTFFPQWVMDLRKRFGALKSRLIALNVHDAVMHLTEGSCDLLLAYHHPSQPLPLNPARYEMLSLGQETLAAYSKADAHGEPLFRLPGPRGKHVPFLSYASGAYLGRLVEAITRRSPSPLNLDSIYETDMAEGLKAMAIEGHGLAFLPTNSVAHELEVGRLVRAAPVGTHELTIEIRIYRERPEAARHTKPGASALWQFLRETPPASPRPAPAGAN